jgi:Xaa-Pro aminopeptidase
VEATRAGHLAGMAATAPGRGEAEVRAAIEREFTARGCVPAYGSIVTVHGEVLHNEHSHHPMHAGDLLLVDAGAENHGWASDVTRTWPVSGRYLPTQRALYDIVLQANLDAIDRVRPGVRYRDVHLQACRTLARGLVDEGLLAATPTTWSSGVPTRCSSRTESATCSASTCTTWRTWAIAPAMRLDGRAAVNSGSGTCAWTATWPRACS